MSAYIKSNHEEDDFLMIGEKYDHTTKSVTGDAKFFVDLKTVSPSAQVDISAAIYLPKLYSYGYVTMVVNDTMATFEGEISLLNGFFNPRAKAEIRWDLSRVYLELGDLPLLYNFITLNHVVLDIDASQAFSLEFDMKVTVLFLADIQASFTVKENGDNFALDFNAWVDVGFLGRSSIQVNAALNTADTTQSSFGVALNVSDGFFTLNGDFVGNDGLIQGDFDLPILGCKGSVQMVTNSTDASFSSTLRLFGLLRATVDAQLKWDLSFFKGSVSKLEIAKLIVVDDVSLLINAKQNVATFDGQVSIPLLGCNSQVSIYVDAKTASFDSQIGLFGGLVNARANVQWRWDGTQASATLRELTLAIFEISDARVEFEKVAGGYRASAGAQIKIAGQSALKGSFNVSPDGIDLRLSVEGFLSINGKVTLGGPDLDKYVFDDR